MFVIKLCYFIYDINTVQKKNTLLSHVPPKEKLGKKFCFSRQIIFITCSYTANMAACAGTARITVMSQPRYDLLCLQLYIFS